MSAPTPARVAAYSASDGIEGQAYEASHPAPVNPAHVVLAEQARRIEHLESVAERQADQRRIDALKIQELELMVSNLRKDRVSAHETISRTAALAADLREQVQAADRIAEQHARHTETRAADYRKVREALTVAEDQRDGFRRLAQERAEELLALRGKIRNLAAELD